MLDGQSAMSTQRTFFYGGGGAFFFTFCIPFSSASGCAVGPGLKWREFFVCSMKGSIHFQRDINVIAKRVKIHSPYLKVFLESTRAITTNLRLINRTRTFFNDGPFRTGKEFIITYWNLKDTRVTKVTMGLRLLYTHIFLPGLLGEF